MCHGLKVVFEALQACVLKRLTVWRGQQRAQLLHQHHHLTVVPAVSDATLHCFCFAYSNRGVATLHLMSHAVGCIEPVSTHLPVRCSLVHRSCLHSSCMIRIGCQNPTHIRHCPTGPFATLCLRLQARCTSKTEQTRSPAHRRTYHAGKTGPALHMYSSKHELGLLTLTGVSSITQAGLG